MLLACISKLTHVILDFSFLNSQFKLYIPWVLIIFNETCKICERWKVSKKIEIWMKTLKESLNCVNIESQRGKFGFWCMMPYLHL